MDEKSPIAVDEIAKWIGPVTGKLAAKYRDIEAKLLDHEWIKQVQLVQSRPDVLQVVPTLRKPVAVWQSTPTAYLDDQGEVFGELDLRKAADLPVAMGSDPKRITAWLNEWHKRGLQQWASVASVQLSDQGILQAVLLPWRSTLHWEAERWADWEQVLKYLVKNHIAPRQIWIQDTKKIVVKTHQTS